MSKCSDFFLLNFSFTFAHLFFFFRDHQIRPLQLATGRREIGRDKRWVAQPNYCIYRRNVLCARTLCVISFHYLPRYLHPVLEVIASRGPDRHDLVVFLAFSDDAAGETCE